MVKRLGAAGLLVAVYVGAYAVWTFANPAGAFATPVDDFTTLIGPLFMALLCVGLPRRSAGPNRRLSFAVPGAVPLLLGAIAFAYALAQAVYTFYDLVLHANVPTPSLLDGLYLAIYPVFLIAILLIPGRTILSAARTLVALDGLMLMAALVTFSWYFILGPTVMQGGESLPAAVVNSAYPVGDLVLILALVLLTARARDRHLRLPLLILGLGILLSVIGDSVYDYTNLHNITFYGGGPLGIDWLLAQMVVGLSGYAFRLELSRPGEDHSSVNPPSGIDLWQSLLPYLLIPAVGGLFVYTLLHRGDQNLALGVYLGGTILIALVILRQIFAIQDAITRNRELRATRDALTEANEALVAANGRLASLATTDALTGVLNHRGIVALLDQELERARRYGRPFAVLFLDADHFKALNDTYGHAVGDSTLRELADVLRMALRTLDSVGRWGGEEFAAILPETNAEGAVMLAERVRSAVAGHTFAAAGLRLTCSVGIATFPDDGENRDLLVETADHAMYAAKRLGRNQVRSSADPAVRALGPMLDTARPRDDALLVGTMEALSALMEARRVGDDAPGIAGLAIRVARAMNADEAEVRLIGLAALLQDIGKAMVPGGILEKPGALTDEEWELVRAHPAVGADAVRRIPSLSPLAPIIRSHHERWDGAGYPDGMAGASIPPEARILGVVSAYTAMINDRPYRQRCDSRQALRELQRCAGTQFDPEVVEALADVLAAESSGESYERVG